MSQIFSTILGGLQSLGGSAGSGGSPGTGLTGLLGALKPIMAIGGIISQYQQQAQQKKAMDTLAYYNKNPQALSNLVKADTQPLSTGLTTGVDNVVQAQMAERGLNQAPGIYQQVSEQALAPYQQQEQQMGIELALQQLGLPAQMLQGLRGTSGAGGLAGLLQALQQPSAAKTWGGGSVGGASDAALNTPGYETPSGPYGPDLAAPDIGSSAGNLPDIFGGSNPSDFIMNPTAGWGGFNAAGGS